jgi:Ca2+/Na+ antiporter
MIFFWLQVLFLLSPLVCLFFTDVNTLFDNIIWYYSILVFWLFNTYSSNKEVKDKGKKIGQIYAKATSVCLKDPLYNTLIDDDAKRRYLDSICSTLSPNYIKLKVEMNQAMLSYRDNLKALILVIGVMVIVHIILGLVYLCN